MGKHKTWVPTRPFVLATGGEAEGRPDLAALLNAREPFESLTHEAEALRRGGARGHGPLSLREIDPAAAAEGSIFLGADAHSEEGMPGDGATRQPAEGWDAATKSQSPVGASRAVASLTRRLTHTGSRRVGLASPKAGGVVRV